MNEAKEIERLRVVLHQWRRFDELESQQIFALARRLLEERDSAREWAVKSVREVEARERIMTCIWCAHEYPPMTPKAQAPILYEHARVCEKNPARQLEQRIASLERERDEARQKHNDHCRTTEVCYFTEKWK